MRVQHVKFSTKEGGKSFIRRIRRKKKTLAVHALWDITVEALKWAIERRPESPNDHLLLNQNGKELRSRSW